MGAKDSGREFVGRGNSSEIRRWNLQNVAMSDRQNVGQRIPEGRRWNVRNVDMCEPENVEQMNLEGN